MNVKAENSSKMQIRVSKAQFLRGQPGEVLVENISGIFRAICYKGKCVNLTLFSNELGTTETITEPYPLLTIF